MNCEKKNQFNMFRFVQFLSFSFRSLRSFHSHFFPFLFFSNVMSRFIHFKALKFLNFNPSFTFHSIHNHKIFNLTRPWNSAFHFKMNSLDIPVPRVFMHLVILGLVMSTTLVLFLAMFPVITTLIMILVLCSPFLMLSIYLTSTLLQWLYAPHIRWHPIRAIKIYKAVSENIVSNLCSPLAQHLVRFSIYRVFCGKRLRPYVARNIVYSETSKNRLDIYLPASAHLSSQRKNGEKLSPGHLPVLIFIYGGAWNSGSKEIYQPLGHQLRRCGILTIIPEYCTYPQGNVDSMLQDVADCLNWTHRTISHYGGDPTNLHICAHSSGAHITLMTFLASIFTSIQDDWTLQDVLYQAQSVFKKTSSSSSSTSLLSFFPATVPPTFPTLSNPFLPELKSMFLLSGMYDLNQHYVFETLRGVEDLSGLKRANGDTFDNLLLRSPTLVLESFLQTDRDHFIDYIKSTFPKHVVLMHGSVDRTVPFTQTTSLFQSLQKIGLESMELWLRDSESHAQPLAQLMKESTFMKEVVKTIRKCSR